MHDQSCVGIILSSSKLNPIHCSFTTHHFYFQSPDTPLIQFYTWDRKGPIIRFFHKLDFFDHFVVLIYNQLTIFQASYTYLSCTLTLISGESITGKLSFFQGERIEIPLIIKTDFGLDGPNMRYKFHAGIASMRMLIFMMAITQVGMPTSWKFIKINPPDSSA